MADDKLAKLLTTQISVTEWLEKIKHDKAELIRKEDGAKSKRLDMLNKLINLPIEVSTVFEATQLTDNDKKFAAFLENKKDDPCRIRLIPNVPGMPKLRMRGKTVKEAYEWFKEQDIDPKNYQADFADHPTEHEWATIFVVNKNGIHGEIIFGCHSQLTQGFHDKGSPITFSFDFSSWSLSKDNKAAHEYLKDLVKRVHVPDKKNREQLHDQLGATFAHNYVEGYFESADSPIGLTFIDYSPTFGKLLEDFSVSVPKNIPGAIVSGQTGSRGSASGTVRIVLPEDLDKSFVEGEVLVCDVTTPDYISLMQKASAIVTDRGGILSHAAIVAREMKKPCIVGTKNATSTLKNNQKVTVDADNGVVY